MGANPMSVAGLANFTVMNVLGSYQQSRQLAASASLAQQTAEQNALYAQQMADRNAKIAEQQYDHEKLLAQQEFEKNQARRRAVLSASGADLTSGSPVAVLTGAASEHEMNLLTLDYNKQVELDSILYEGQKTAYAYNTKAASYEAAARNASSSTPWAAGQSLLAGGLATMGAYKPASISAAPSALSGGGVADSMRWLRTYG